MVMDHRIGIKCTADDKAALSTCAQYHKMTDSEMLRWMINQEYQEVRARYDRIRGK